MRNLKKTLAVVLAFAMILSMGLTSMAAYSDVTAGTKVSEAVDILSGLNILTGFEDGTFKPEETVTRAQMAAIICRMLGYEDQAKSSMGSTVFNDVAADHWASGYINVAQAQQIINGYGDGNYGPEDLVTYEQAVKMIVSALGYDLAANAKGGYPTGYLAIASAEGITKSANGKVGDAAARGTIAVLVYNSLEVQLMDQSSWSTGNDGDKYEQIDETILSKYLEITKWEGILTQTPAFRAVANNGYDATKTPQAVLQGSYFYYSDDKLVEKAYTRTVGTGSSAVTVLADYTVDADKVDVNGLLGKAVVAYIGEDAVTGNNTIYAIAENENKNEVIKVSAVQLAESGESYYQTPNTLGYKEIGSTRVKDLDITGATAYVNYKAATVADTEDLETLLNAHGGVVELISNDADSDIEYIVATAYGREAVIENVENNNGVYTFDSYTDRLPKLDTEDADSYIVVYKDGAAATVADIAANDTVSYVKLTDGFEVLYVSSATVTGLVDSFDPDEDIVTIAGTDYQISKSANVTATQLSGEEGVFFLNVDGQIAHNETAPTAVGKYAFVVAAYDETSGVKTGSYLQVVLADGTVAEYEIAKTAKVVTDANLAVNAAPSDPIDTDAEFKAYFAGKMTQLNTDGTIPAPSDGKTLSSTYKTLVSDLSDENLMVKLTVSNNKVVKARLLPASSSAAATSGAKYDAEAVSLGNLDFDNGTVVFSVEQTSGIIDPDDIKVGTVADFFVDEEAYTTTIRAYDADANTSIYGAIVGCGIIKPVSADSSVFVVMSTKTTTYDDGDAYVVTGMQDGEVATYTIYNEDASKYGDDPSDLVPGEVLLLADADSEGIVSKIKKLVDLTKVTNNKSALSYTHNATEGVDALDQIYSGIGEVTSAGRTKFMLNANIFDNEEPAGCSSTHNWANHTKVVNWDASANSGAGALTDISYRNSATYTLVDFSENAKNPEVTLEDGSEYTLDTAYGTYAYVRYVEGKMADVVVYRMAEKVAAPTVDVAAGNISATQTIYFDCETAGVTYTVSGTASGDATVTAEKDSNNKVIGATITGTADGQAVTVTVTAKKDGCIDGTTTVIYTIPSAS